MMDEGGRMNIGYLISSFIPHPFKRGDLKSYICTLKSEEPKKLMAMPVTF